MKFAVAGFVCLSVFVESGLASTAGNQARDLEKSGDPMGARAVLIKAVQSSPADTVALREYAEYLDRYGDLSCRAVYRKLLPLLKADSEKAAVARRLTLLNLLAGDRPAASESLSAYRAAGGTNWTAIPQPKSESIQETQYVEIPGPMRSFIRMAAISSDVKEDEILPALARNIVTNGFQASRSNDALEQTEYLKLVVRYLSQARELEKLAGKEGVIAVESCEAPVVADLLKVLGFRIRGGCGSELVLETVNASRAFLSTDSNFPIAELEQSLRTNRPFKYDYKPMRVPVLYGAAYWLTAKEKEKENLDFIDVFLSDPTLCRLYLGMSKLDLETAKLLKAGIPAPKLRAVSHVLDFFGSMFELRNGAAVVPGAPKSIAVWTELAGAAPNEGVAFFEKLLTKDDGWLCSYFDSLLRASGPVREYLTDPARMRRFYAAVRGRVTSPGPARPVFRANADMMLLTTRLRLDASGKPQLPGGLEIWKNLFTNHPQGKYDGKLTKAAAGWKEPDDLLEALFGLSRKAVENEPLKIFMAISDIDRNRARPLEPATVDRLAREYRILGGQYAIFNDSPGLRDETILAFVEMASNVNKIKDPLMRADSAGVAQGLIGVWQILARHGVIAPAKADETLSALIAPFATERNYRDLFDAGRAGIRLLLQASGADAGKEPQQRLLQLLAGTAKASETEAQGQMMQDLNRIFEAQRIISLDTLFELADHMESLSRGEKLNTTLVARLANRVAEIQLPRSSMTTIEKNTFAFGFYTEKHVEGQRKLNLRAVIERAAGDAEKLKSARGLLAPFLRDTLVAFSYAYYAPPGAQILYTNPLFVRGHDFIGVQGSNHTWRTTELFGTGWPSNGGGKLVGSLAGLPYAIAEAEQNFLVPSQTQALIWGDLVPQMILSAKIPRWWTVSPRQMHWIGVNSRYARDLLIEASLDEALRGRLLEILSSMSVPARTRIVGIHLQRGDVDAALSNVTPAELYFLGVMMAGRAETSSVNVHLAEIRRLEREIPQLVSAAAISRAFGTPKPTLANSYQPELLNLRTFPTLMGYSSRILAESWESNTLYWVALADEVHLVPSQLNLLIPEWTQKVVERIFASNLEDWPALLRSLRIIGEDVRAKAKSPAGSEQKAGLE